MISHTFINVINHSGSRPSPEASVKPGGFTLVEMLILIAIIGILAVLLMLALRNAKKTANRALCQNNQRQCYIAIPSYAEDWQGHMIVHPPIV